MDHSLIDGLRVALATSPVNQALRRLLAKALLEQLRFAEAEAEYRLALDADPRDRESQLGLARAFAGLGKRSAALVLCEEAAKEGDQAGFLLLHARLLGDREPGTACRLYRQARQLDSSLHDDELERMVAEEVVDRPVREKALPPRLSSDGSLEETTAATAGFTPEIERPSLTFADVGGMEPVKEEIRMRIIYPLANRDLYAAYGKKAGGGILLYGPPGCGKTYLARATAGEVKVRFIAVGINDILDMWIGASERNLHSLFTSARENRPCVLFFDEVDALAASRRDLRQSASRQSINQFLSELDGVDGNNDEVLIMAATNAPWHLDSAFRRPGRFDRIIFVPPPDEAACTSFLVVLLQGKPAAEVDVQAVARKTPDFSGADLKAVVEHAIEEKLTEAMRSGRLEPLTTKVLLRAVGKVKPSTREWFTTARNHALYANENGLYDPILAYLKVR